MYVLHLSKTTLAGVPRRIASLINKYSDIKARSATAIRTHIKFPEDIIIPYTQVEDCLPNIEYTEELDAEIKKADIIHIHNLPPFAPKSPGWGAIKSKPIIQQFHSPPAWCESFYKQVKGKVKVSKHLVIAQYQAVHLKIPVELVVVRNVIDINDDLLKPIIEKHKIPIVTYCPSNQRSKDKVAWAYKSGREVKPVMQQLSKRGKCRYIFISGVPFEQCLSRRQNANIHIDEVSSGSYHLASLEALSQGTLPVANIATWMEKLIKEVTGCTVIPWQKATESTIKGVMVKLVSDQDRLLPRQKACREWMENYWNPQLVLNDYLSVYKEISS